MTGPTIVSRCFPSTASTVAFAIMALLTLALRAPAFAAPIHDAVTDDDLARVKSIVAHNPAALASKDADGDTPLHLAAELGYADIAKYLIAEKASVNAVDNAGYTPLHLAEVNNQPAVQKLIAAAGGQEMGTPGMPSMSLPTGGQTPLIAAAQSGNVAAIKQQLKAGADVDAEDDLGITALGYAAAGGSVAAVRALIAAGAYVDASGGSMVDAMYNRSGGAPFMSNGTWTPLMWAANNGHADCVSVLLAAGADVNGASADGMTALMLACKGDHIDCIKALLAAHANVTAKDNVGDSALSVSQDARIRSLLTSAGAH